MVFTDSIQFLDFLKSDFCQKKLIQNNFKIHIEIGNIFFNYLDRNELVYDLFQKQENIETVNKHNEEFTFTDSYEDYFKWLVDSLNKGMIKNMIF